MSHADLENTLRSLPQVGTRLDKRDDRGPQIWRFEHDGKPFRLHFYPRRIGSNPALRELQRFQQLQKAGVRSQRAISAMVGFRLGEERGDALLLESVEPSISLEQLLIDSEVNASPIPHRKRLLNQLIEISQQLAKAGLGHDRLEIENFVVHADNLYLVEASGVRRGGLRMKQLLRLASSASRFATRSDYVRAAMALGAPAPKSNRSADNQRRWRRELGRIFADNEDFGTLESDGWTGVFTRRTSHPLRWASASRRVIQRSDWESAWPELLAQVRSGQLSTIKNDASGTVTRAQVRLGDAMCNVIVKSPKRKFWRQAIAEFFRGSRARRTWIRTWKSLVRGVPTEWPMLFMERRASGGAIESILVFQQIPGETLATIDLDRLDSAARENLFRRAGRSLRQIEELGFTHADAKSTNWVVFHDPVHGPRPILIDLDGVRHYRWSMMGIDRLLRAMRQHPQYTPTDSKNLCQGYAPNARLAREQLEK
ncbi:MAG: hypothetical protein H7Z14_20235 [Anaerolineae bacterium]|nr:hypothetical protein [Phycisphaerae bacterium]